jgi:hypothetical protein
VLVVVVTVSGVSTAIMDVVDMVTMRNRHMPAPIAVDVGVVRVNLVLAGRLAFVVVIVMPPMKVTVVQIVDVVTVRDCNMSAAFAVGVRMTGVFVVDCLGHCSPPFRPGCACYECWRVPTLRDNAGRRRKRLVTARCRGC